MCHRILLEWWEVVCQSYSGPFLSLRLMNRRHCHTVTVILEVDSFSA